MSKVVTGDCPKAETLAAFIDGTGKDQERNDMQTHLESCQTCMSVLRETSAFGREESNTRGRVEGNNVVPMRGPAWWMTVAAGVGIVVVGGSLIWQALPRDPLRELYAEAAKAENRPVEGRLLGMQFKSMTPVERSGPSGKPSPAALRLRGKAGELVERLAKDDTPSGKHAVGVALLVNGEGRLAVEQLEAATGEDGTNSGYWSDLSAALLNEAKRSGDPREFARAVAAAERALQINPGLHEARFNRGAALDAWGRYDQARDAYRNYLEIDSTSEWADEVRERVRLLETTSGPEGFPTNRSRNP